MDTIVAACPTKEGITGAVGNGRNSAKNFNPLGKITAFRILPQPASTRAHDTNKPDSNRWLAP